MQNNFSSKLFLSTMIGSLLMVGLVGCQKTIKAEVQYATPLAPLTHTENLVKPVFHHEMGAKNKGFLSSGAKQLFSNKQQVAIHQQNTMFQVAYDDVGYVVSSPDGVVSALDLQGKPVWQVKFKQGLSSGVSLDVATGTVIVNTSKAETVALNRQTGQERWRTALSGNVLSPSLVTGHRVVGLSNNGVISGLSLQTGKVIWQFATPTSALSIRGSASPVLLGEDMVLVATSDGRIHAIQLNDGLPRWVRRVSLSNGVTEVERMTDVDATPLLDDDILYAVSYNGNLMAIDMAEGRKVRFVDNFASLKTMATDEKSLYLTTNHGQVVSLDKKSGHTQWQSNDFYHRGLSNVAVYRDYVIVGDAMGYLHVLDKKTGKTVDRQKLTTPINHVTVANHRLLIQSPTGALSVWRFN